MVVKDVTPPSIVCPANITASANTTNTSGASGAIVTYTATASDNCGISSTIYSPASGSFFPVGTTLVTTTVTDVNGLTSTCSFNVTVTSCAPVITVSSTPTSNTYTGGAPNSLFIGYGAQSTTLNVSTAVAGTYTYAWSGTGANKLSSTTTKNPVFTPSAAGSYTFSVTVTSSTGCKATGTISICVTDIRVIGYNPPTSVDPDDNQGMCDHQAHDSSDCPHEGHNHPCDHKAHSKYTCAHRDTNDENDDDEQDCDHKAHTAAKCPHKGHNHKACDHKAHSASNCEHDKSVNYGDVKVCDHKAHSYNDCTHEGHNHKYCNHQAHAVKDCPHNGGNGGNCNSDAKVYLCHVPPGNPGKTITLSISVNAVADHLANHPGDRLGSCEQQACTAYTDVTNPVITCPAAISVSCGSSTDPKYTGSATATDNLGFVTVTYSDANGVGFITRTWKATDAAGNFSTCAQMITIVDNVKPTISDPSDVTVTCSSLIDPSITGIATATDNCSTPNVTYSDAVSGNVITRTWKATDASGNFSTSTQVITVNDNIKPVISDPADITVACGSSTLPAATGVATATDNCSTPTVTYGDVTNGNVITRTWTAKDAAGNISTSVQIITIGAAFTPVITSVPTNTTYTGGICTNLYLGYGAQSTTLQLASLPSAGAPYTYVWSGNGVNGLNSKTVASPVFTPTTFGYYTFNVTVTNKFGCSSTASISICVTDIRVPNCNNTKVYVTHSYSFWWLTYTQNVECLLSDVSKHIQNTGSCGGNGGDRLGSTSQSPCNSVSLSTVTVATSVVNTSKESTATTLEENLKVTAMPNPSTTYFTLKIESKYETPVSLRVMDGSGRVVDAKSKIGANSTIQIGHNYSSGTYYAELIQGGQRKVVQLIKAKG